MAVGLRAVWPLFLGVLLMQLGHGLGGSLVSVQATAQNFTTTTTGLVMAGFYLGMFVSSIVSPPIISNVGHIRAFAAFASLVSTAVLLIPLWPDPIWWFLMRVIIGICIAGLAIVVESWLNAASSNEDRGKMLSIYMIVAYAASGAGSLLLNIGDTSGFVRFIVVSALLSLALVPISLANVQAPAIGIPRRVSLWDVFTISPLAFVGTFAAGLGQSAFFSMGPVYGLANNLSLVEVSIMMALPPLALLLSQYPVGSLSDRFDRRIVMTILTFVTTGVALFALFNPSSNAIVIIITMTVFGAISFPIYSLCLAHANDYLEADQMLGASAKLVLIYGAGAICGPIVVGFAMHFAGPIGYMTFLAFVHGALGFYALSRMFARPETPDETSEYITIAPQSTPVVAQVIAEEYEEQSPTIPE